MKVIYKYQLSKTIPSSQKLCLPKGSRILSVGNQREDLVVWAVAQNLALAK